MKPPKLDRGTFVIVGAVSAYIGLRIFAAGVEWERERTQKLEDPASERGEAEGDTTTQGSASPAPVQ